MRKDFEWYSRVFQPVCQAKTNPDDFWPTFSTKNIHTKCTQLSEKHHHAHKNCHNSDRPIQHLRKFVYWIYFRLSPVCQWISFYSTRIFYFSYQVHFSFPCTHSPCLCTLMMRFGLADTYIHTHIRSEWKKSKKKIALHSEETRFVICSFQTTKQLYRVLNFPQLRESKPQKKNTESAFEMRNSFYFHSSENNNERRKKTTFWE